MRNANLAYVRCGDRGTDPLTPSDAFAAISHGWRRATTANLVQRWVNAPRYGKISKVIWGETDGDYPMRWVRRISRSAVAIKVRVLAERLRRGGARLRGGAPQLLVAVAGEAPGSPGRRVAGEGEFGDLVDDLQRPQVRFTRLALALLGGSPVGQPQRTVATHLVIRATIGPPVPAPGAGAAVPPDCR